MNEKLVECRDKDKLTIATNGGSIVFSQTGTFKLFLVKMYFNKNSLATILALCDVADIPGVHVCMDMSVE